MDILLLFGNTERIDESALSEARNISNAGYKIHSFYTASQSEARSFQSLLSLVNTRNFDVIHYIGHSEIDGLLLESGDLLKREELTIVAQSAKAKFVFLNSCSSAVIAQHLVDNGVQVAISYAIDIFDSTASNVAAAFYNAFGQKTFEYEAIRKAFDTAKTVANGRLIWHTDGAFLEPLLNRLMQRMDKMDEERHGVFNRFEDILKGIDQKFDQAINQTSSLITSLSQSWKLTRNILVALLVALILILAFMFVSRTVFGQTVPIPTPTATKPGNVPTIPSNPTPTRKPTNTPRPKDTATAMATETIILLPTPTETPTETIALPTSTNTPVRTEKPTVEATESPTETIALPTSTSTPVRTEKPTVEATESPTETISTPISTNTPTKTQTPTVAPTETLPPC